MAKILNRIYQELVKERHQPFIDGFVMAFPRFNLGQIKGAYDIANGHFNADDMPDMFKYVEPVEDYYQNKKTSISEYIQLGAGALVGFPLSFASFVAQVPYTAACAFTGLFIGYPCQGIKQELLERKLRRARSNKRFGE